MVRQSALATVGLFVVATALGSQDAGPKVRPTGPVRSAVETPKAIIQGPDQAAAGDLVILDASGSVAEDFGWVLVCPDPRKCFLPVDGGRRCVFASGTPGRYVFVLAVAGCGRVATAQHTVTVGTSPPTPEPDPHPGPVPPDGKFHLAKLARDWAMASVALEPSLRRQTAQSLAGSFDAMAAAIAAGTLREPAVILSETRKKNNEALGEFREAWKAWGNQLAPKLEELHRSGQLRSADDYAEAWREIADGLRTVMG